MTHPTNLTHPVGQANACHAKHEGSKTSSILGSYNLTVKTKHMFLGVCTCFENENNRGFMYFGIFLIKPMITHINRKLSPRPFELYG